VAARKETTLEQRARARLASSYTADSARQAMDLVYRHGGSTSARQPPRRVPARPAHRRLDRHPGTRVVPDRRPASISASTPAHACADSQATKFAGTRRLRVAARGCSSRDEVLRVDQAQIVEQRFLAKVPGTQSDIAVRTNVSEFGIVDAERGP
jgi:hypothetical protein